MTSELVFWVAVSIPLYAFLGYPLVLLALGLMIRREVKKAPIWPFVSLLIPAYNEARVIARKIENSLALDYPPDRIEIVIVSDGSTDETVNIARSAGGVRVLALPKNRGKVAALNAGGAPAQRRNRGLLRCFGDPGARCTRRLVENFSDGSVGAVCGRYSVVKPNEVNIGASEDFYWRYEAFLKTPGVAARVHVGRTWAFARHSQGALSLPAA